jgi:hypothetical protein
VEDIMDIKSDLEFLVEYDMYELGYDPSNKDHIKQYWEMMLNGD